MKAERDMADERAAQAEAERDDLQYETPIIRELREILGLGWGESITEKNAVHSPSARACR